MKVHPLTAATAFGLCACSVLFSLEPTPEPVTPGLDASQGNDATPSPMQDGSSPSVDGGIDGSASMDASNSAQYLVWAGGENTQKNDAGEDEAVRNDVIFLSKRRPDGTLEPWQQGPTIPFTNPNQRTSGVAAIGRFLYILGPGLLYELSNGTLKSAGSMPPVSPFLNNEPCMVALGNRLYINDSATILTASASGATVGGWQSTSIATSGRLTNTFPDGEFLYFAEPNRILRLHLAATGLPDRPVEFVGTPAAPTSEFGTISGAIAVYSNQLFQLGGFPAGPVNHVWQTERPADSPRDGGSLVWRSAEPLPQTHENTSVVRTDTHLYVVGHYGSGLVSSTPLLAQGAIGIFSAATPLPKPLLGRCNAALLRE